MWLYCGMDEPEDPLAESAPIAWRLARELCTIASGTAESCAWEHAPWQSLRLLGLLTSPDLHKAFYRRALSGFGSATPAILVSGAADYSMLVQAAFAAPRGRFTVIDRCETP